MSRALSQSLPILIATCALAPAAEAYVGPGAGFALVGSLLAVLSALLAGALAMLLWPLRALLRAIRRRPSQRSRKGSAGIEES